MSVVWSFLENYGWTMVLTAGAAYSIYQIFRNRDEAGGVGGNSVTNLFLDQLEDVFEQHPRFFRGGLTAAVEQARQTNKAVLVYIHDQDPRNTNQTEPPNHPFCRDILCSPLLSDFLKENFVCWASIWNTRESAQIRNSLNVRSAPFLAALYLAPSPRGNRQVMVQLWRLTNTNIPPEELLVQLVDVVERREAIAVARAAEESKQQTELAQTRQLVQDQDKEYQMALEADRLEQEKKMLERQKLEEQKVQFEQEQKQAQNEAEHREKHRASKKALVGEEPSGEDVITARLRLPDASSKTRKFLPSDTMQHVFDFIESLQLFDSDGQEISPFPGNYRVVTSHPRAIFDDPSALVGKISGKRVVFIVEEVLQEEDSE